MLKIEKCFGLFDAGFSLLTVAEDKIPNFSWSKLQKEPLTPQKFSEQYNYKGGKFKRDGSEIKGTKNVGIITGYNDLECIDIDLKVLSTAMEQVDFWEEFYNFLSDNIYDFEDKFVIYKTQNAGYHIIYKTKRVEGNKKIAKLKGHKTAIIETRGVGGYIFAYENNVTKKTYKDVEYISDEDREILFSVCQTYDYIDESKKIDVPEKEKIESTGLSPWQDFNNKTNISEIISPEISIIRNLNDKYMVRREGATSPHSGYIYKNSGCMYLFSTGTIYPAEELITPFKAYTYKYHSGDFSSAAKDLYQKGFGDRMKPKPVVVEKEKKIEIDKTKLEFPVDIFPVDVQEYILECKKTLNSSVDYMGCALLWLSSVAIGNSMAIKIKSGWTETANVWLALVGKAGIGKTPSIYNMTFPLQMKNSEEIKNYYRELDRYDYYQSLDKKTKELSVEVQKPRKTQFIVNDVTLEALIDLHSENKNCVGVLKDELAGWFKEMNRYREGSDLEHWLSSWSGKEINLNRKTARSSFVDRAFMPVLGGIQPSVLDGFYTEENKENGFIDRILFSYPDLKVDMYNDLEISESLYNWYFEYIQAFYSDLKKQVRYFDFGEIKQKVSVFDSEAKKEWVRIFNKITKMQNSEEENEYLKSMLPKQKSYIPRFALLLNTINEYNTPAPDYSVITKESIIKAEKLSEYFIHMARKIKLDSMEVSEIKRLLKKEDNNDNYAKFKAIYIKNNEVNRSKLAESLNISVRQIHRYVEKLKNEKNR